MEKGLLRDLARPISIVHIIPFKTENSCPSESVIARMDRQPTLKNLYKNAVALTAQIPNFQITFKLAFHPLQRIVN